MTTLRDRWIIFSEYAMRWIDLPVAFRGLINAVHEMGTAYINTCRAEHYRWIYERQVACEIELLGAEVQTASKAWLILLPGQVEDVHFLVCDNASSVRVLVTKSASDSFGWALTHLESIRVGRSVIRVPSSSDIGLGEIAAGTEIVVKVRYGPDHWHPENISPSRLAWHPRRTSP